MMVRSLRQEALKFDAWRRIRAEWQAVGGQCSYADIHRATGIPYETVAQVCRRNGWECRDEDGQRRINQANALAAYSDVFSAIQTNLDRRMSHV